MADNDAVAMFAKLGYHVVALTGKHVDTEKPLATGQAESFALEGVAERRGLRNGCAPDNILGSA